MMRIMNDKGFTLVELMVVLAILGLLAGIGIPQYTKVMERARVGRDVAAIATVQTAVDAFVAEIGGTLSGAPVQISQGTGQPRFLKDITNKDSVITSGKVKLSDYIDGVIVLDEEGNPLSSPLPKLESSLATTGDVQWYIDANAKVYLATTSGTKILP